MTYWAWSDAPDQMPDQSEFRSTIHGVNLLEISHLTDDAAFVLATCPLKSRDQVIASQRVTIAQDCATLLSITEADYLYGVALYTNRHLNYGQQVTRFLIAATDDLTGILARPSPE